MGESNVFRLQVATTQFFITMNEVATPTMTSQLTEEHIPQRLLTVDFSSTRRRIEVSH